MPNQKKSKATPKSTPSKATPKASPKSTRGKTVTPKKGESPKPSSQRESRSSTPSNATSPKVTPKKTTPTKTSPKTGGKPAATKASPKGKASPKSNKNTPKKVASPKSRQVESESSESEDEATDFKAGAVIDAQWEDGLFYSAKIIKVNKTKAGNTYNVEFTQDLVQRKNLKRNQIQSYTDDDSEGDVSPKHKASIDDQEYVEGQDIPLRYGDESVESDSTESPRTKKAGRKPASKRKREAPVQTPSVEKKRKLTESLAGLTEKQLVSIVKKACASNVLILDTVQELIPEPTPPKKAAPKPKVKAVEKAPKATPKNAAPVKKGKTVASGKKGAAPQKKGTRSNK
jgi:hypothetical protein